MNRGKKYLEAVQKYEKTCSVPGRKKLLKS